MKTAIIDPINRIFLGWLIDESDEVNDGSLVYRLVAPELENSLVEGQIFPDAENDEGLRRHFAHD